MRVFGIALGLAGGFAHADDRPAVVELFTSQGCSSCPPADTLLGELSQRSDVIALAYHVDYWDYLGWKDHFSLKEATDRQRLYARSLRLSSIYTPQMVVDGTIDAVGSDRRAVEAALAGTHQGPAVTVTPQDGKLMVSVAAPKSVETAEVTLVAYSPQAETKILRGENAGRSLKEYSIVRGIYPLGQWNGGTTTFSIDLAKVPGEASMVAVLVQAAGQGAIIGATAAKIR